MDDQQTRITYFRNKLEKRVDSKTMVIVDSLIKTCLDEPINCRIKISFLINETYYLEIALVDRNKREYWYLTKEGVIDLVDKIKKIYNVEEINNDTDINLE